MGKADIALNEEYNSDQDQADVEEVDNDLYEEIALMEEETAHHRLHLHQNQELNHHYH